MKNTCNCLCGGVVSFQVGEVWYIIKDKRILVHNVPHYHCSICGSISYNSDIKLTSLLKEAYNQNLKEVDYKESK